METRKQSEEEDNRIWLGVNKNQVGTSVLAGANLTIVRSQRRPGCVSAPRGSSDGVSGFSGGATIFTASCQITRRTRFPTATPPLSYSLPFFQ
jgi:hypothetical protein